LQLILSNNTGLTAAAISCIASHIISTRSSPLQLFMSTMITKEGTTTTRLSVSSVDFVLLVYVVVVCVTAKCFSFYRNSFYFALEKL